MAKIFLKTLEEFISENNVLDVPIYQRGYTWDEKDVEKFFNDIINWSKNHSKGRYEKEDRYYIGSCITYGDKEKCSIVDGQQRITTTFLMLAALKKHMINDGINTEEVDKKLFTRNRTENTKRIKLNNLIESRILEGLCDLEESVFEKESQLVENFNKFYDLISNLKNGSSDYIGDILDSLEKVEMPEIIISDRDNPTKIFETINNTGKKLIPTDLIKNFIFFYSYKFNSKEEKLLSMKYDRIETFIKEVDIKGKQKKNKFEKQRENLSKFFRYYNTIEFGCELANEGSYEIYDDFINSYKDIDRESYEEVLKLLNRLELNAWIWNRIHNLEGYIEGTKNEINKSKFFYQSIRTTLDTYYCAIHEMFLEEVKINDNDATNINTKYHIDYKKVNEILKTISNLAFSLLLTEKKEKNITRDIPRLYKEYNNSNYKGDFYKFLQNRMNDEDEDIGIIKKEDVLKYIENNKVYKTSSKKTKFLLWGIESLETDFGFGSQYSFDDLQVEHICPQTVDKDSDYYKYALSISNNDESRADVWIDDIKDKLYNLTLLPSKTNKLNSNKSYSDKLKIFKEKAPFKINQIILNYEEWHLEEMNKRKEWLKDKIIKLLEL